ncbi:MAG: hypothetical protein RLZZ127_2353, partial [Planctomycetota bacterium]
GQAHEVDGATLVAGIHAAPGDRLRVRITAQKGYDLVAEPVA